VENAIEHLERAQEEILEDCRVCCIDGQPCSKHVKAVASIQNAVNQLEGENQH